MFLENTEKLTKGSHKKVCIICDFKISEKCRLQYKKEYRHIVKDRKKHDGKDICVFCHHEKYYSGRNSPVCKYKKIDDDYFNIIDTEEKAYILGIIATDGHCRDLGIEIVLHKRDRLILERIRDCFSNELPLKEVQNAIRLKVYSKKMSSDICRHLQITPGNKTGKIKFPILSSEELTYSFLRGALDGDGSISKISPSRHRPNCKISNISYEFSKAIFEFCKDTASFFDKDGVYWTKGNKCLDFLGKLYNDANIYMPRKRDLFLNWSSWVPSFSGKYNQGQEISFSWVRTHKSAIAPHKTRISDSGYDLTLIEKVKQVGDVEMYTTGIRVIPDYGWYFVLVPRSSIINSGYILANNIGIIDRTYVGPLLVPLIKIDKTKPDLILPCKLVQIIPMPVVHFDFKETLEFEKTQRGDGGFGSTDKYEKIKK